MKKNLAIFGLIFGILAVSLVSAFWPFSANGNVVKVGITDVYTKAEVDSKYNSIDKRLIRLESASSGGSCATSCRKIWKVREIYNGTIGTSGDRVTLVDIKTNEQKSMTPVKEGLGNIVLDGISYNVTYVTPGYIREGYYIFLNGPNNFETRALRDGYLVI